MAALGSLTKCIEVQKLTRSEKRERREERFGPLVLFSFDLSLNLLLDPHLFFFFPCSSFQKNRKTKTKQTFLVANAEVAEALILPSTGGNAAEYAAEAAARERLAGALSALDAATEAAVEELDAAAVRARRRAAAAAAAAARSPSSTSPSPREARDASVKALNALASALSAPAAAPTR